ncbi:MAG: IS4 family transposase [Chloroflexi bacterium CG_4_10_14_0_8_um_filter_57_5]|nr:MAG: IS4 family transposase [Chloroflexi bacterium CG_4_10_14_0_8_um_filter_57_5]
MSEEKQPRKASSVRHTRAIQRDRTKHSITTPTDGQIRERLTEIVHPVTLAQMGYFRKLGLRERTLGLIVMVAFVLDMIWRQISGVSEMVRLIQTESVLWVSPTTVSQQAFSQRLTSLPAELFLNILMSVLPRMQQRWAERKRPLPPEIAWAQERYSEVQAVDGSTLDALIRKIGLLKDLPQNPLAGKITALLNLGSRLPSQIWYAADPKAHDQRFWMQILAALKANSLLIFDMGYIDFDVFIKLTLAQVKFITRAKSNLVYVFERAILNTPRVRDSLVWIGKGENRQLVRLVEVLYGGKWYRYLSNELDTERLPTAYLVALYWQRWRIEDAYAIVKRLLGLAYFWCGAQNAVEMQVWATWLLYVVLVDLTDAVAEALNQPFAAISIEMVYRSLYFFTQAHARGQADDVVTYLAANTKLLGIVKRKRKGAHPAPLELIPTLTDANLP